ncbi:AMP-binding protein [Desulfofustis glycolicus]|uniref:Acyl-CoA synthetase (AMP-forming)/AMP-acid ligase II n=1 Tax=Desulfofustis glycolicus DSM 9705 TaxID=1121409 RepID=A0A1M5Y6E7_9BACT|nr:AMP-binding protein [Desulfofustis glycolicus]MCB2216853.1 AMP-binding protein [Desulfobulbaceae bacterium]SHI07655.1 Acyl-CoA synthetase (AMP-forming)/AMP-acid ligase II [Desulfofustis glycolicus DSM 9705]
MNQHLSAEPGSSDFGEFAVEYQFWVEHQNVEQLLTSARKLIPPGATVLDAGCGEGFLAAGLATAAARVVALDLSQEMLALARRKAAAAGAANVSFVRGDIGVPALRGEAFDLVVSSFALHHTDVERTLPLLAGMVKPGGWLLVQEPTCPVAGAGREMWYRWHGLVKALKTWREHGSTAAWRIGRFLQSRAFIGHQLADRHWPEEQWRVVVQRIMPDGLYRHDKKRSQVVLLWQCPEKKEISSAEPEGTLGNTPFMTPGGVTRVKRRYTGRCPDDYEPFPRKALSGSVISRFESIVERFEGKTALRTKAQQMSYGELNAVANQVATRLLQSSRTAGAPVVVLMDQDDPSVPAMLGVLKAGKAYAVLDPNDTPERLRLVMQLVGAETVLTTGIHWKKLEGALGRQAGNCLLWEELAGGMIDNPGVQPTPEQPAALFFTSGSTGQPKGVVRDHQQLLHSTWVNTNSYYVAPSDRRTSLNFPGFSASVPNVYDTLLNGATICSLNPRHVSPAELVSWLISERVTIAALPVGLWREILHAAVPETPWQDLRLVTLAGQSLYGDDVRHFLTFFGPSVTLLHRLAMTEAGTVAQGFIDGRVAVSDGLVPVGYPVEDKEIAILDETGTAVGVGSVGLLAVASMYLSVGYWGDEARTQATFRPAADGSGKRVFITSDRACLRPDGCLEYYGREDSIVKVRGYRVDMAAIEVILNSCSRVRQAAVIARMRHHDEPSIIAYLVGDSDQRPSVEELRALLRRSLPHYMVPGRFSWLEEMPLTTSGKIDRQALSRREMARPELSTAYVLPGAELERRIARIWSELLDIDQVGMDDDFFELGGDSLTAMRLMHEVEQVLGHQLPSEFLHVRTIRGLLNLVTEKPVEQGPCYADEKTTVRATPQSKRKKPLLKGVRRMVKTGPVWGKRVLPFPVGTVLQRVLVSQLWLHRSLFSGQLNMVLKWQEEIGVHQKKQALKRSLVANLWSPWRSRALMTEPAFRRWVTIAGEGKNLLDSPDRSGGVLLVVSHAGWMIPPFHQYLERRGIKTASVVNDQAIDGEVDDFPVRQMISRTEQLQRAERVLQQNGAVFIAGDGLQGRRSVDIPFFGRWRPFQTGPAWLAVTSSAHFVPVFVRYDEIRNVQIEIAKPLTAPPGSEQEQVEALSRAYGRLYVERWRQNYTSIRWHHLKFNYELPRSSGEARRG